MVPPQRASPLGLLRDQNQAAVARLSHPGSGQGSRLRSPLEPPHNCRRASSPAHSVLQLPEALLFAGHHRVTAPAHEQRHPPPVL